MGHGDGSFVPFLDKMGQKNRPRVPVIKNGIAQCDAVLDIKDFNRIFRLVGTLELEGNGQGVPYGHGLTILATRGELGQRLADANGLLIEILIH